MRRWIFTTIIALFLSPFVFSQAQMGTIEYQRKDRQAVVIYSQYPPEIVEEAIKQRLTKAGNKGKDGRFLEFKNASIPEYNLSGVDLVFKVEPRSRKEKDESVVYMIVLKGPDNFATSETDPDLIESSKNFLVSTQPHIEAHNLEVEINKQDEAIKKAEKKLSNLIDDQQDLEKKIRNLQEKLEQNRKDQEAQKNTVANHKSTLENMKGKRKS
jgi:hypothetical protein